MAKKTCMICQPFGIGDILFIQKIIMHFASLGYHVIVPILDKLSWMRYYLVPRQNVEYPLITTRNGEWKGDFKFSDMYMTLYSGSVHDKENQIYKSPIAYNNGDEESGFIFLALSESYNRLDDKLMPAKYNFVGVDFSDWVRYVHLKRRPHVERELYYDVLGLTDDSRFTLVNGQHSRGGVSFSVPGNTVQLREIDGFTLFDWSLVIEKSAQIVTVDTSLVILAEILNQQKPLYMISRYDPPSFEPLKDILKLDWNFVLTPADLNVNPA